MNEILFWTLIFLALSICSLGLYLSYRLERNSTINHKENTAMKMQTYAPSTQQMSNNFAMIANLEVFGFYELYATSLATSKDSKGSSVLFKTKDPMFTSLRTLARFIWNNFPEDQAQQIIIHVGIDMDANAASYKAVYKDDVMLAPCYFNYWQSSHVNEMRSYLASLGYRTTGQTQAIVAPAKNQPLAASLVSPLPASTGDYPKSFTWQGNTYVLSTKGVNGMLADGSMAYVGSKDAPKNKALSVKTGETFATNGNMFEVVAAPFAGKNLNIKVIGKTQPIAQAAKPSRKDKTQPTIASYNGTPMQGNVKPLPAQEAPSQESAIMLMLQQIMQDNATIKQALEENNLL